MLMTHWVVLLPMLVMRCATPGLGMDSALQEAEVAALLWLLWWARLLHHLC